MHVRRNRDRQAPGELLRLEEAGVLRGDPRFGQGQHRPGVPEHTSVGFGLAPQVGHGLAVAQLHRMEGPAGLPRLAVLLTFDSTARAGDTAPPTASCNPHPPRPNPEEHPLQVRGQHTLHRQRQPL